MDVWEGSRYEVEDTDELADALASGNISIPEVSAILRSFDTICRELKSNGCSGMALLKRYAPELPY